ncbi:MAG TPA: ABC transporter substrate-binding protein [Candidatus Acidoferrales bacterium]|jgi:putative ABC transport system substrate-binding protein|nr:ABC transporter substrate-binding protein [Candidatus Acidoferrales bacterium]
MSEVVRRLWLGVALIAASSAFLLLSDTSRVSTIPHVAVLQFSSMQALDDGARGLLDYLKEHGYDGTHNAVIERFNAENDVATSNAMAREITSGRYQFVISVSTNCLQAVANANRAGKAKHLFGIVADPVAAKVGVNPKDPADHPKHMTGIGSLMPVDEIMEVARRMNPRVQRFGIPWNPSQANSERYMELAREAAAKMKVEILEGSVDSSAVVGEVTSALIARGADVIVVIGDVTVGLAIDSVIAQARKGKIPVVGALPDYVSRGALFAAGADFYQVGRQMGEVALRMFHGEDPAKIPIIYSLPKTYGVNLAALDGLKDRWQVPPDLLAKANTVVDASGVRVNKK